MIRLVALDWGNTVMRDLPGQVGPMAKWPIVEAMPGIKEALAALAGRYRLALATNAAESGEQEVRQALERVGLNALFELVQSSRDLPWHKPQPEFYRALLDRAGCGPGEAAMVGDGWDNDVQGALAAGLAAVWYNPLGLATPKGPAPQAAIRDLRELTAVIGRLDGARG